MNLAWLKKKSSLTLRWLGDTSGYGSLKREKNQPIQ